MIYMNYKEQAAQLFEDSVYKEFREKLDILAANLAKTDFDAAKEAYLKLFTYTDVDSEMNTEEVLLYAGLTSYFDEHPGKRSSAFNNLFQNLFLRKLFHPYL